MRKALLVAFFVAAGAITASAQNVIYFPHVADGNQGGGFQWKTTIFLTNPAPAGSGAVSGSVTFTAPSGLPLPLSFVNESGQPVSSGASIPFQIAGSQTRKYISTAAGVIDSGVGYATVTSNGVIGGTAVFSFFGPQGLISEAAVPAVATPVPRQAIIVDTTAGFDTGVAIANPGASPSQVTLSLINVEGQTVMTTTANKDNPVYQTAKFVSSLFLPNVPPPTVGTLQISSSAPLAAVGLRFASTGAFTTVPTITLASLMQPALKWFGQKPWVVPFSSVARLLSGLQYWRA